MLIFDEIMKQLFYNQTAWYVDMFGKIKSNKTTLYNDRNNCTSLEHIEKWLCINDLLNVAYYFNKQYSDAKNTTNTKYYICLNIDGEPEVRAITDSYPSIAKFFKHDDAVQAIEIIGRDKLRKILI